MSSSSLYITQTTQNVASNNYTTLYSSGGAVTAATSYGNANVEAFLNSGTDGGNTIANIVATGNITTGGGITSGGNITARNFIGNLIGNITGNFVVPGANTDVIYNYQGNAAASNNFTFNQTSNVLTVVGNITSNNLSVSGLVNFSTTSNVNLGSVSNVHLGGGAANYILQTDGAGNLSWTGISPGIEYISFPVTVTGNNQTFTNSGLTAYANSYVMNVMKNGINIEPTLYTKTSNTTLQINILLNAGDTIDVLSTLNATGGGGAGIPGGSNTTVQYNDHGTFNGSTNFTWNSTSNVLGITGNVSANYFIGSGNNLSNIQAANITGLIANANYSAYSNVANYANYAGAVVNSNQPNISSVGTLSTLSVTGNISTTNYFIGNGYYLTGISGGSGLPIANGTSNINIPVRNGNIDFSVGGYANIMVVSSNGANILGDINVSGNSNINNSNFTQFNETVVLGGSVSGVLTPSSALGTIYEYTLTGNIVLNSISSAIAGTSITIVLKQDSTGGRTLTSTMRFQGGSKTLSITPNAIDIVFVFYDGTNYYATLTKGYA